MIKKYIEYYYNINVIDLIKKNNTYKFMISNTEYLFLPLYGKNDEILEIYSLIQGYNDFDQIIKNNYDELITHIGNGDYILIKKCSGSDSLENCIVRNSKKHVLYNREWHINKTNWSYLWSRKIDYIEYQFIHFQNQYPIISKSIWYYIGMAENAIEYINDTIGQNNLEHYDLVIAHRRIDNDSFTFPFNLIVDYASRDASEYLKYMFLDNKYDYSHISEFIHQLSFNEFELRLLYGRLFFVTFYFDLYDLILAKIKAENELLSVINRSVEYEDYIKNIYSIICSIKKIPEIGWV